MFLWYKAKQITLSSPTTQPFIFIPCPVVLFAIPLRDTVLCIPSCLCGHGYTGVHCELDIDFCSGHQCSEHAVCLDQQHNYTCHCILGYEGAFCELETDECKSAPCANRATCIDLVAGYQCLCAPGFKGKLNVLLSGTTEAGNHLCAFDNHVLSKSNIVEFLKIKKENVAILPNCDPLLKIIKMKIFIMNFYICSFTYYNCYIIHLYICMNWVYSGFFLKCNGHLLILNKSYDSNLIPCFTWK